jgi:hypothetical protein
MRGGSGIGRRIQKAKGLDEGSLNQMKLTGS